MCCNTDCPNTAIFPNSACSRCNQAYYCTKHCRRADNQRHSVWCKAAAAASNCTRCQVLIRKYPNEVVLDGNVLGSKLTPDSDEYHTFVVVYHSPFQLPMFAGEHRLDATLEHEAQGADTIVFFNRVCQVGIWHRDFDKEERSPNDNFAPCVACSQTKNTDCRVTCPSCKSPTCADCVNDLLIGESATMLCPRCKIDVTFC